MEKSRSIVARIAFAGLLTVMLFVVLSTATYAWYSTNQIVNAGTLTFKSSIGDSTSTVTIGKDVNATTTTMTFDVSPDISPMIPTVGATKNVTTFAEFSSFQRTFEGLDEFNVPIAKIKGESIQPLVLAVEGQKFFYLNNLSEADVSLKIEYEIKGELEDQMHVAMFVGVEPAQAKLLCIMSKSGEVHYGNIEIGQPISDTQTMQDVCFDSEKDFLFLSGNESICIRLVVWLDGVNMKNKDGGKTTTFSLSFSGLE